MVVNTIYKGKPMGFQFVRVPFGQFALIYRESGTSFCMSIGTGPGTGRKRLMEHNFPFWVFRLGILECFLRHSVYSGNFPVGQTKIAGPLFYTQPKIPAFCSKW